MNCRFAVIGVGNMAKSILAGILTSELPVSDLILYDKNNEQYTDLPSNRERFFFAPNIEEAVSEADCILLSVKPQNFAEILGEIKKAPSYTKKLFISIAAGISSHHISEALDGACVIRVLPNLPMTIGMGVSLICENKQVSNEDMKFVQDVFCSAGNIMMIREEDMNPMIGVTSSAPAYVFQLIDAMYQGATAQGLKNDRMIDVICDTVIGSAMLLKQAQVCPQELISKVASKGGTTEQALSALRKYGFDEAIVQAMLACTQRANELGKSTK